MIRTRVGGPEGVKWQEGKEGGINKGVGCNCITSFFSLCYKNYPFFLSAVLRGSMILSGGCRPPVIAT